MWQRVTAEGVWIKGRAQRRLPGSGIVSLITRGVREEPRGRRAGPPALTR